MKCSQIFFVTLCVGFCLGNDKASIHKSQDADDQEKVQNFKFRLPKDVIVIGAGIAGLAAARRLTTDKTNFTVTVYEARKERFGGHIWTDKLTNMKAKGIITIQHFRPNFFFFF